MNLFKLKNSFLGIDIGSRNIKAIQIRESSQGWWIEKLAILPISLGTLRQGLFLDLNLGEQIFKDLSKQMEIGKRGSYLGISGQNAIVREIELPLMNDQELAEAIYWEADKVLPYSVEDAIIDWIVLEQDREIDQKMRVLLLAGRKDYIRSFLKPAKNARVRPQNLSILPIPLIQVLKQIPEFTQYTTVAVIDMAAEATHVLITKDGLPRLSRTIPTGGNDFTEAIANSFTIPLEEAEQVKIEFGSLHVQEIDLAEVDLANNPYLGIEEILYNVSQDIIGEIRRSFVHFQLHNRGQEIQQVYLTGGSSLLSGMIENLNDVLKVPIVPLDLSKYFSFDPKLEEELTANGVFLAEALGLALSGV